MSSPGSPISQSSLRLDVVCFCGPSRVLLRFFIMGARYCSALLVGPVPRTSLLFFTLR